MSRRAAAFVLGLALALILGGALWWFFQGRRGGTGVAAGPEGTAGPAEKVAFDLYLPAEGGLLRPQRRELQVTQAPKDRIRKIVGALLAPGPGGVRLFPEGAALGGLQLGKDGIAYVDLVWDGHGDPPASGSTEEMQRVYGIVNSITANVPEAKQVVLLWNGTQRTTFSGHLDTGSPLAPNQSLVAR